MAIKLNIADRWRKYVARKSKLALFFDLLFVVLLILVVIPSTRRTIAVAINRYTLFSPRELNEVRYLSPKAYDFKLVSTTGDTLLLSDIKHKVLFVNFWATWCPPCVAELPSMQRLYDAYGQEAAFLFISTENQSTLTQFLDKKGYTIPVYRPLGNIPADFDWTAFPTTFVVSKEGRVVIKKVGSAKWDGSKMKEVMERLTKNKAPDNQRLL